MRVFLIKNHNNSGKGELPNNGQSAITYIIRTFHYKVPKQFDINQRKFTPIHTALIKCIPS